MEKQRTLYVNYQIDPSYLSLVMRKPAFCICKNKEADQLRGNYEADQRLCFRYTDSTTPLLYIYPKVQASSHLLWLYSPVCVEPGQKSRRPVFSQRSSSGNTVNQHFFAAIYFCVFVIMVNFA